MALYQDSGKKGKYRLEYFNKCSSKILLARTEIEDPLDLLHFRREVTGKGGQNTPDSYELGHRSQEARPGSHELGPGSHEAGPKSHGI